MTELQIARALAKACGGLGEIRTAARALPSGMADTIEAIGVAIFNLESAEEGIKKRRRDSRGKRG